MNAAIVRLECFGQSPSAARQQELTESSLQEAYMRGLKEGTEAANTSALNAALEGLRALSAHLQQAGAERDHGIDALISQGLSLMLDALMEHVAPLGMKQRLSQFVSTELLRIGRVSSAPQAMIKCPSHLLGEMTRLVTATGTSNIKIEETPPGVSGIDIIVEESVLTFDPQQFTADLRDLIKDIS